MVEKIYSSVVIGVKAELIEIEVNVIPGLPQFTIVGLASTEVKEAKERVYSAIKSLGYHFPQMRKIVNLAPAHIKKSSTGFDLGIAYGLLKASKKSPIQSGSLVDGALFLGELSLKGEVRGVEGVLPALIMAKENGITCAVISEANASEVKLVSGILIYTVQSLKDIVEGQFKKLECELGEYEVISSEANQEGDFDYTDFSEIKGQEHAKRALIIAAAGGHNICFSGPPGGGKTMLAKSLKGILPPLQSDEAIEVMSIYSAINKLSNHETFRRPFRHVHSGVTELSLIGGGQKSRPGEVSLAHKGVLFMDELLEFSRPKLEALRQPLEDNSILINRLNSTVKYPADFMFVATLNPCPCGYLGDDFKDCICKQYEIERYAARLSGPLKDRIDLHVVVPRVDTKKLFSNNDSMKTSEVKQIIKVARAVQHTRFNGSKTNSTMGHSEIREHCVLSKEVSALLKKCIDSYGISARGYTRILKVARTIADLDASSTINKSHILEAMNYRSVSM